MSMSPLVFLSSKDARASGHFGFAARATVGLCSRTPRAPATDRARGDLRSVALFRHASRTRLDPVGCAPTTDTLLAAPVPELHRAAHTGRLRAGSGHRGEAAGRRPSVHAA